MEEEEVVKLEDVEVKDSLSRLTRFKSPTFLRFDTEDEESNDGKGSRFKMICMFLYTYMPKGIERGQEKSAENNISVSIISFTGVRVMNALFTITMLIFTIFATFCLAI